MSRRVSINLTLPEDVVKELELEAKTKGDNRSRVFEMYLRRGRGMPAPVEEPSERRGEVDQLAPTRSERTLIDVLKAARPEPLNLDELIERSGLSPGIANKSLLSLERRGLAVRWAYAVPQAAWMKQGELWGAESPRETLDGLISQMAGSTGRDLNLLIASAGDVCCFMGDYRAPSSLEAQQRVSEASGLAATDLRIRAFTERVVPLSMVA